MVARLPKEIIFAHPPLGVITIQTNQMGYKRKTNIRLKRDGGKVYFKTKHGAKYVQSPTSKSKFVRQIKK